MDPYLEGWLWPDVHRRLGVTISNELAAVIDPRYTIRLETSLVSDDEIGVMYPDVYVYHPSDPFDPGEETSVATLAPPITVPAPMSIRSTAVRIRLGKERTLVTSIEIVSPANKYGASFEKFRQKWSTLRRAGVSLVEIDLVRRGQRIFPHPGLQTAPYLVTVTRSTQAHTGGWPFGLREPLPVIPIPLLAPDPDARLDLQQIFALIYEQGRYSNDIDYSRDSPPPPALSVEDAAWVRSLSSPAER